MAASSPDPRPDPAGSVAAARERLAVVLAGHVDHGKSTVVGRLLHDRGALPAGRVEALRADCARRGMPFEWGFVTDALQAERGQGVTIDASHVWLRGAERDLLLIDAPGHHEFIRNMITGAAAGDAAFLVVDARDGVCEQSRRHAYILHLLGIRQIAVALNKMDLADFDRGRFAAVADELTRYFDAIGLEPTAVIPTVGPDGDNIVARSARMPWYEGPTADEALAAFAPRTDSEGRSLRLRVQDVYRWDGKRVIAGRVDAGTLSVGDDIMISPANETARVAGIEAWRPQGGRPPERAVASESIGLTLDRPLFVQRGDLISHLRDLPFESNVFTGRIFWLAERPLAAGGQFTLKLGGNETAATIEAITHVVDLETGAARAAAEVPRNGLAEVVIRTRDLMALDSFEKDPVGGRFMLLDNYQVVGGGTVALEGYADQRPTMNPEAHNVFTVKHRVSAEERARRHGVRGAVFWLTGLSGAGKSTIAMGAEQALFRLGYPAYVLDGDNLRRGLNTDLGFSPEDRAENIRRVGEVAALFADAGNVVITAFISPYRAERERVRHILPERAFHEVHVRASLAACEDRDPKGLYARARKGEIADFTGVSAPYEAPERPELVLDTERLSPEEAIQELVNYCRAQLKA